MAGQRPPLAPPSASEPDWDGGGGEWARLLHPLVRQIALQELQSRQSTVRLEEAVRLGLAIALEAAEGLEPALSIQFKTNCSTRVREAVRQLIRIQSLFRPGERGA